MKYAGGYKQILTSIVITITAIIGFYVFKYACVLPRINVDDIMSMLVVGFKYFFYCTIYLIAILLLNTILMYSFKKTKYELLSLSFASSYLLIVFSATVIGVLELYFFENTLEELVK